MAAQSNGSKLPRQKDVNSYSPGRLVTKSYRGLHLILSTLSGIPYTSVEVSLLTRLVRLARFPLP
ncbi:hypothetical protein EMIT0P100_110086 [Pseudomonas sp. IT-P100]